jgi:N-formylglutamate amidohydrolase
MSHIVLNIPHSGVEIPAEYRGDILLSDAELQAELELMTDKRTDELFVGYTAVTTPISRLVCDIEKFADDSDEPAISRGMGAVYTKTADGRVLREFDAVKREAIMKGLYNPYHEQFTEVVRRKLVEFDKCLIIDCHSYDEGLVFLEGADVDVCIGTDKFHTPDSMSGLARERFTEAGYSVAFDKPFEGTIVPREYLRKDSRVKSIMIELNKRVYLYDEAKFQKMKSVISGLLRELAESNAEV